MNVTAFEHAAQRLRLGTVTRVSFDDAAVREAVEFLGITPG